MDAKDESADPDHVKSNADGDASETPDADSRLHPNSGPSSHPNSGPNSGRFPSSVDAAADEVQNRIQNLLDESVDEVVEAYSEESADPLEDHQTRGSEAASGLTGIEAGIVARGAKTRSSSTALPEFIGSFKVLRLLGEGGMGVVYEAQQERPQRRVAIKLLRFGMNSPRVTARFRLEAEFLARLQHPGIARVYESGTIQVDGAERPYLVMELISGVDLLSYAQRESLNAKAIIRMMADICDAVQHAHQRGVIHRDLKPSNIVVGTDGQPRILDFGIARASDDHHSLDMAITRSGEFVGTLPYMSPEQVSGRPDAIDVRSDVYSLGVIAYQLLSGALPIDVRTDSLAGAARRIADEAPPPLNPLDTSLGRDLNVVIGKAIEKLPGRRYASADAFRDDLMAVIQGQTVSARPPTALYQIHRFAGRNKALVASSALIAGVVVAGLITTSAALVRARSAETLAESRLTETQDALEVAQTERDAADVAREEAEVSRIEAVEQTQIANLQREEAEEQRRIAEAITDFLNDDLIGAANPDGTTSANLTVREAVNRAANLIDERFADDPTIAIRMNITMGRIFFQLAALEDAERVLRSAEALLLESEGPDSIALLNVRTRIANAMADQGRGVEAETLLKDIIEDFRRLDPEAPNANNQTSEYMLRTLGALSAVYLEEGRTEPAIEILTEVLAAQRAYLGATHMSTLTTAFNLAGAHYHLGAFEDALDRYREVLVGRTERFGPDHPATVGALAWVCNALTNLNRPMEVIDLLAETIDGVRHSLGPEHPSTLQLELALGQAYHAAGMNLDALEPMRRAFEGGLATYGPARGPAFSASTTYARILMEDGQAIEAINVCSTIIQTLPDPVPPRLASMGITLLGTRGHAFRVTSQHEQAIADLQRAIELALPMVGADHPAIQGWESSIEFSRKALEEAQEESPSNSAP